MKAIVVMGVAGCGKSTIGAALAEQLGCAYVEGDDLHGEANISKMSSGQSLTDADRLPWLQRIGQQLANSNEPMVVSCSALKRSYRDTIRKSAGKPVLFVHLAAPQALIAERMSARRDHFMPTTLLDSQFQTLEPLQQDEVGAVVDISQTPDQCAVEAYNIVEQYYS
jgi:carbohydrate kinase (thermoresistant glucokinase family)